MSNIFDITQILKKEGIMKKKILSGVIGMLFLLGGMGSAVFAAVADDLVKATESLEGDYKILSDWIGKELCSPLSFLPGIGPDLPANVLSLPGFEIGLMLGTSMGNLDTGAFNNLSTETIEPGQIDIPKTVAIPIPILHAKTGLPSLPVIGKTDIGIKLGTLSYEINDCDLDYTVYGIQLRKEILEDGITSPGAVSISLSFNKMNGKVKISRDYNYISQETYEFTYDQNVDSVSSFETKWDISSVGLMAMYSKKVAIINLFLGVGVDQNSGDIDTTLETTGTLTLTQVGFPTNTLSDDLLISASSSCDPEESIVRLVGGVEFGLTLLKFGLSGEYSEENYAVAGNVRFQF